MDKSDFDWDAYVKNMTPMIINMDLEKLPGNLENLVEKSYEFAKNAYEDLKKEAEKAFADISKMPDVVEYTDDGEPYCEKFNLESQAEDYFMEQGGIIEIYNKSIDLMLINFFVESFEGLKKKIGNKLKESAFEINSLKTLVFEPCLEEMKKVRLINNCIKHNDSKVSKDLNEVYPAEFIINEELKINQELVYELLKITIKSVEKFTRLFNQYYKNLFV